MVPVQYGPMIQLVLIRTITWIYYILLLLLQFGQLSDTWLSQGKYDPSAVWAQLSLGKYGPSAVWAHLSLGKYGPSTVWAQLSLGKYGPSAVWGHDSIGPNKNYNLD